MGHGQKEGGGYTFETEIARACRGMKGRHQLCVCTLAKTDPKIPGLEGVEHISLYFPFLTRLKTKLIHETHRRFGNFLPNRRHFGSSVVSTLAAKRLKRAGVQLNWYLSQWAVPVVELPYVMTIWDLQHRLQPHFPEVSANGEWDIRERQFKRALSRPTFVVTGSNRGRDEIERFYGVHRDRIRVLPMPTPSFAIANNLEEDPSILAALNLPGPYLFYPAQFWSHKNQIVLLQMLRILKERRSEPICLVLVGNDFGNRQHIEATAVKLGVADRLRIPGFVSRPQLIALYRNALALSYSSFFGPDNLPPLEAMALGCPVIVGDFAGAEEQLGDAALHVPCGSESAFAEAVIRLLEQPNLRSDLIGRGRKRAQTYTVFHYSDSISEILDEFEPMARCWNNEAT